MREFPRCAHRLEWTCIDLALLGDRLMTDLLKSSRAILVSMISQRSPAHCHAFVVELLLAAARNDPLLPKPREWPSPAQHLLGETSKGYVQCWWERRLAFYLHCIFCSFINCPFSFCAANLSLAGASARTSPKTATGSTAFDTFELPRNLVAEIPNSSHAPLKAVKSEGAQLHEFDLSAVLRSLVSQGYGAILPSWSHVVGMAKSVPELAFLCAAASDSDRYSLLRWGEAVGWVIRGSGLALRVQVAFLSEDSALLSGLAGQEDELMGSGDAGGGFHASGSSGAEVGGGISTVPSVLGSSASSKPEKTVREVLLGFLHTEILSIKDSQERAAWMAGEGAELTKVVKGAGYSTTAVSSLGETGQEALTQLWGEGHEHKGNAAKRVEWFSTAFKSTLDFMLGTSI
jgi:hypothetical protein